MLDFEQLGKYSENNRIEAKQATGGFPRSLWETYSAFANTTGGVILLGVVEEADHSFRAVELLDPEDLVEELWAGVKDPQVVSCNILSPEDVYITQAQGKRIVVIEVPRAKRQDRPVYLGGDLYRGSYRRSGEGDYHCTPEEVRNMLRDRGEGSLDQRLLPHLGREALDEGSAGAYCRLAAPRLEGASGEEGILLAAGALGRGEDGGLHPTAAGLLMLGELEAIRREYPDFSLEYREYDSPQGECALRLTHQDPGQPGNLFTFYTRVRRRLEETLEDSEEEVRRGLEEALANGILHGDYYDRKGLVIIRRPGEWVVSNPGTLRLGLGDALAGGRADPRNAGLTRLFALMGVGRQKGSGLSGILAAWAGRGWTAPRLEERFGPDRTILSLPLGERRRAALEAREQRVLEYITRQVTATPRQVGELLEVSEGRARALLEGLARQGVLQRGPDHLGYQLKS